jgi:hypothetical protein
MCPTNVDVTCVQCAATLETGTSSALMTFGAIHHRLEASCAEVTFDVIYLHAESPPSDPATPQPRLGRSSVLLQRVMLWLGDLHGLRPASPTHCQPINSSILNNLCQVKQETLMNKKKLNINLVQHLWLDLNQERIDQVLLLSIGNL